MKLSNYCHCFLLIPDKFDTLTCGRAGAPCLWVLTPAAAGTACSPAPSPLETRPNWSRRPHAIKTTKLNNETQLVKNVYSNPPPTHTHPYPPPPPPLCPFAQASRRSRSQTFTDPKNKRFSARRIITWHGELGGGRERVCNAMPFCVCCEGKGLRKREGGGGLKYN